MARNAHRDEVIRVIAFILSPLKNMMHIHLDGARHWLFTKHAPVAIPSLDKFADSLPAFAAITVPTALPVWRFVASESIGGIVFASPVFHAL